MTSWDPKECFARPTDPECFCRAKSPEGMIVEKTKIPQNFFKIGNPPQDRYICSYPGTKECNEGGPGSQACTCAPLTENLGKHTYTTTYYKCKCDAPSEKFLLMRGSITPGDNPYPAQDLFICCGGTIFDNLCKQAGWTQGQQKIILTSNDQDIISNATNNTRIQGILSEIQPVKIPSPASGSNMVPTITSVANPSLPERKLSNDTTLPSKGAIVPLTKSSEKSIIMSDNISNELATSNNSELTTSNNSELATSNNSELATSNNSELATSTTDISKKTIIIIISIVIGFLLFAAIGFFIFNKMTSTPFSAF